MKVGLIGCGEIGKNIAEALLNGEVPNVCLKGIVTHHKEETHGFLKEHNFDLPILPEKELLPQVDLIIESASASSLGKIAEMTLNHNKDLVALSACGLLGKNELLTSWKKSNNNLYIPSAAIAGLDGVLASNEGKISSLKLIIKRPSNISQDQSFGDFRDVDTPTEVFCGTPIKGCRHFPGKVNISAALSLAGPGPKNTELKIIIDPEETKFEHRIIAKGEFGGMDCSLRFPLDQPTRTKRVMSLSTLALLRKKVSSIKIGT